MYSAFINVFVKIFPEPYHLTLPLNKAELSLLSWPPLARANG